MLGLRAPIWTFQKPHVRLSDVCNRKSDGTKPGDPRGGATLGHAWMSTTANSSPGVFICLACSEPVIGKLTLYIVTLPRIVPCVSPSFPTVVVVVCSVVVVNCDVGVVFNDVLGAAVLLLRQAESKRRVTAHTATSALA
jgi:hypothetical protein